MPDHADSTTRTSGSGLALVTGAAGGIGAAVTAALRQQGRTVVAADLQVDPDMPPVPAGGDGTGALVRLPVDVTDTVSVDALVERVERDHGPIAVLVSTAGVLTPGRVLDTSDADWARTLDVNATGVFRVVRAVAARMVPRRAGSIITVASNAASVPRTGMVAYAASKAAAVQLTRCLALELAEYGIRANVVSPGSTDTPMLHLLNQEAATAQVLAAAIAGTPAEFRVGIPLGRVADPVDVAAAVAFLASDAARHITMQELYVDGGASLR